MIRIELPDGRVLEEEFKQGVNVEWAAYVVSEKAGYRFDTIEIYHEGVKLLNPLSLADYPQI